MSDKSSELIGIEAMKSLIADWEEACKSYREMNELLVSNLNTVIEQYNELRRIVTEAEQGYDVAVVLTGKAVELGRSAVLNPMVEQESRLERLSDIAAYSAELKDAHTALHKELSSFPDKLPTI